MNQYCRYCVEACAHSENDAYCGYLNEWVKRTSRRNKCKGFEFNPRDAFAGWRGLDFDDPKAQYKPKEEKPDDGEQIRMGGF